MNIPSIFLALALCLFLIVTPHRLFLFPFIMAACFVPMDQRIIIQNIDFTMLRILILVGFLRLVVNGETRVIEWNYFDIIMLSWVVVGSLVYMVQYATLNAVIYKSGVIFDSLGMYWLFRQVMREWGDAFHVIKIFALFAIITAPLIALEKIQESSSVFSIFGHVQGQFHRGRFRAAGPFPHYIMMGCFWGILLPFFYARIKAEKDKALYWCAIIAVLSNVYCSASSTPIMTVLAVILFWNIYTYRMHGKTIFWTICTGLFCLHLIMKAPVWHLLSRVDVFDGSTGWHRYFLFDNFIRHASEWFFFGTKSTGHWGHAQSDITNQFVLQGVRGGIITLLIFIALIYCAVAIPGKLSMEHSKKPEIQWFLWGICVLMLSHFVTFWGVSYFGQIDMLLYFTLALVGFSLEKNKANVPTTFK